jgi:phosphoribosyl 1,2-cyclic phosphodiesterase
MSIELCILASGSGGNCSVLRTPGGVVLIDVGIGPRTTAKRLQGTGVTIADVAAICLTHLDRDHFSPTWVATLIKFGIRIRCHASRVEEVARVAADSRVWELIDPFGEEPFEPIAGLLAHAIRLDHDESGSHGFIVEGFGSRLGYATDLGCVPEHFTDRLEALDMLAIESNYDPRMQLDSERPWFLKQRIMGGRGHLSNEQAFAAICRVLDRAEAAGGKLPAHIVLLHRSRQCNCPHVLQRLFSKDPRIAARLTLAEQHARTEWLRPRDVEPAPGKQLALAWG